MIRYARLPLATVCLAIGGFIGTVVHDRLLGQPALPLMPRELTSYRDIVKLVVPAVVSIEAKVGNRKANTDPNLGFGSGVIIDAAGVILTNFHVVEGADTLEVQLSDGRKFAATDVRRDTKTDLAIFRIQTGAPLPFLEFGDSDAMEVGDRVLAVGAPFGLTGSVSHGIVSAKARHGLKLNQYEDFLQTDAPINPGNSGGPLVSLEGKIIGINAAIKTRSGGSNGVGLAISSNLAKDVSQQLLNGGVVRRGYLGTSIRDIDADLAKRLSVPAGSGVLITKVYDKTPAAKAGLKAGDAITSIGGMAVKESDALPRIVAKLPLNKPVEVIYIRDGKTFAQKVTIEEQPQEYGAAEPKPMSVVPRGNRAGIEVAGTTVTDLTPELSAQLGFPKESRGALVTSVDRNGPSAMTGLMRGVLIVKVDKVAISSAKDFAEATAKASKDKGALVQVVLPTGETEFVVLK